MTRRVALMMFGAGFARADGWQELFNGRDLDGWWWTLDAADTRSPCWQAADGVLRTTPDHGVRVYLLTRDFFSDFELAFEWRAEKGANSGIKYRFQNDVRQPRAGRVEPMALEYQIADDVGNPDAVGSAKHSTAAVYEYVAASKPGPAGPDVWHSGSIVARGLQVEHWLNGRKVVDLRLRTPEADAAFAISSRRSAPVLARHERRESPIALQFHDGLVEFRSLRIRRLVS